MENKGHRKKPKSQKRVASHMREVQPIAAKRVRQAKVIDNRPTLDEWDAERRQAKYVTYSKELADRIIGLIAEGYTMGELAKLSGFPSSGTMSRWMVENEYFSDGMRAARSAAMYLMADQIITIADEATPETVQVAKLRVEVRQWVMGRYNRGQFGDKVEFDGSNGNGKLVIQWQGETSNPTMAKVLDVVPTPSPAPGDNAVDVTP